MRYATFGKTGYKVSKLGLGGAQFGIYNNTISVKDGANIVRRAYDHGINYFDTAPWYGYNSGHSERVFGEGLRGYSRNSFFMATKVGRYERDVLKMMDLSAKRTESSVKSSLERLGIDYLDLAQVHDFEYAEDTDVVLKATLPTLDRLRKQGLIKYIGLASYSLDQTKEMLEKSPVRIDAVLNHSCLTLIDQQLRQYMDFLKGKQVGVINASVLAHGLLVTASVKNSPFLSIHLDKELVDACQKAIKMSQERGFKIERLAYGYSTMEGDKIGVDVLLTGSDSVEKLTENVNTFVEGLTEKEMAFCDELQRECFANLKVRNWVDADVADFKRRYKIAKADEIKPDIPLPICTGYPAA